MALNMASSSLLTVVIFMLHAIRNARVTFEALNSWFLTVSVMSAFVAMYMNVVTIGLFGMLVVSSQHALTNLGSLNPSAYHSLWLFSIVIVCIWGHLGRRNPASRLERMRARRSDSACRRQLKALVLLSVVRGGHCMTGDPGSPTGGGLGVGEQDVLQRMLHLTQTGTNAATAAQTCIRKVECPILKFSFSRGAWCRAARLVGTFQNFEIARSIYWRRCAWIFSLEISVHKLVDIWWRQITISFGTGRKNVRRHYNVVGGSGSSFQQTLQNFGFLFTGSVQTAGPSRHARTEWAAAVERFAPRMHA